MACAFRPSDLSYDAVLLIDVLHHSDNGDALLCEARRLAKTIVIKDVVNDGVMAGLTLRIMDRLGNERLGVACPFNFWTRQRWIDTFTELGLTVDSWNYRIGLYRWPSGLLFERSMHFIACLAVTGRTVCGDRIWSGRGWCKGTLIDNTLS
jgi:hypothetical protein